MAPIKFEERLKEKLDKRIIMPSDGAWESLASQLDATGRTKGKKFLWYGIAAGFVGILILSVVFFKGTDATGPGTTETVATPPIKSEAVGDLEQSSAEKKSIVVDIESALGSEKEKKGTQKIPLHDFKKTEVAVSPNDFGKEPALAIQVSRETPPVTDADVLIAAKVADVVEQVAVLEKTQMSVTDAEVDSLLRKARNELMEERLFKNDRIDAMALLDQAESELDQSFRDHIFEALKDGFFKVRTAVASRNE